MAGAVIRISGEFDDAALKKAAAAAEKFGLKVSSVSKDTEKSFGGMSIKALAVGSALGNIFGNIATDGLRALGAGIKDAFADATTYQTLQSKTAAVIASTGNAANISVSGLKNMAGELESMSGVNENLILNGENVLATFTNIQNKVGAGNDIFDQATKAALDMSQALGSDLQGANIQLGKALNDPIKGITALSKVGVSFTEQQKDQIKALVKTGDTLDAQKVILAELGKEFGGTAKAAGATFGGSMARAKDAVQDMLRNGVTAALPMLTKLADGFVSNVIPAVQKAATQFGNFVKPILKDVMPTLHTLVPILEDVLSHAFDQVRATIEFLKPAFSGLVKGIGTIIAAIKENASKFEPLLIVMGKVSSFIIHTIAPVLGKVLGGAFQDVGKIVGGFIGIIGDMVQGVGKAVVILVNGVIMAVNALIRAYNVLPFHKDIATLSHVTLPEFAKASQQTATTVAAAFTKSSAAAKGAAVDQTKAAGDTLAAIQARAAAADATIKASAETQKNAAKDVKTAAAQAKADAKAALAEAEKALAKAKATAIATAKTAIADAKSTFEGVKAQVMSTMDSIVAGAIQKRDQLRSALDGLKSQASDFSKSIGDGLRGFASVANYAIQKIDLVPFNDAVSKASDGVTKSLQNQGNAVTSLAAAQRALQLAQMKLNDANANSNTTDTQRVSLQDALITAQDKLATAQDALATSTDGVTQARLDQVDAEKALAKAQEDSRVTSAKVLSDFQNRISQTMNFMKEIGQLRSMGLNSGSLQDVLAAGADTGSQIASAIIDGGKTAVDQINTLQAGFESEASKLGDVLAKDRFGTQIDKADQLLQDAEKDLSLAQERQQSFSDLFTSIEKSFSSILSTKASVLDALKTSLDAAVTGVGTSMADLIANIGSVTSGVIAATTAALAAAQSMGQKTGVIAAPPPPPSGSPNLNGWDGTNAFNSQVPHGAVMDPVWATTGSSGSSSSLSKTFAPTIKITSPVADPVHVATLIDNKLRMLAREMGTF